MATVAAFWARSRVSARDSKPRSFAEIGYDLGFAVELAIVEGEWEAMELLIDAILGKQSKGVPQSGAVRPGFHEIPRPKYSSGVVGRT